MVRAVEQAVSSLRPASLAVGERDLPPFMRNRRKTRLKDPALWLMRVDTRDGRPIAALVNLTAHGTVLDADNREFSADWMGATQAYLEREVPGLTALYSNGAEGDISPNIPDGGSTFEGAKAHGEKGGAAALALYRSLAPRPEANLEAKSAMLDLPGNGALLLGIGKQIRLQTFRIGDALLVAVPGEMITQLGLAVKEHARRQGVAHPAVLGLSNEYLGYFLTRAEMKRGRYEATVSFFGEGFGEELTLALARLISGDVEPVRKALEVEPEHD
jgi:hypothetical protein